MCAKTLRQILAAASFLSCNKSERVRGRLHFVREIDKLSVGSQRLNSPEFGAGTVGCDWLFTTAALEIASRRPGHVAAAATIALPPMLVARPAASLTR